MLGLRLALCAIAIMGMMTAGVGVVAVIDAQSAAEPVSVVLQVDGSNGYWKALIAGAKAAAAEHRADLVVLPGRQRLHPGEALLSIEGGKVRATCGIAPLTGDAHFHVGLADYSAGRSCAALALGMSPPGSRFLLLINNAARDSSMARLQGFQDAIQQLELTERTAAPEVIVETVDAAADAREEQLKAIATRHQSAAVVIDFSRNSASDLSNSFPRRRGEAPRLVTFDQGDDALKLVETGDVAAIVAHDSFQCGYLALQRLLDAHRSHSLSRPSAGKGYIYVRPTIVRAGNVAEFRAGQKLSLEQTI